MLLMVNSINECIKRLYGANRVVICRYEFRSNNQASEIRTLQPQPFVRGQAQMGFTVIKLVTPYMKEYPSLRGAALIWGTLERIRLLKL